MERLVLKKLEQWMRSADRKPLILEGARQVGKTWILKEFGRAAYENMVYFNCDNNPDLEGLFRDFDMERILRFLSAVSGQPILPGKTLIILDEIQEIPYGLTSLKYFCEQARDYHVAACGSLLGMALHTGTGYPVGKTDHIRMYPMSFEEFLMAAGREGLLEQMRARNWTELSGMRFTLIDLLRQYYYTGGMPEAVEYYFRTGDLQGVRRIQKTILAGYERDISKHAPKSAIPRIHMVWESIPAQLAKENKKFIYGVLKKGARAKEYETAIQWLIDAGLVQKVVRVNKLQKPLKFYEDLSAFKLFLSDLGLMGAMADTAAADILAKNTLFEEYKGAFTEQYVAQQCQAAGIETIYYHSADRTSLEIDFVLQNGGVYAVEVKAEENLRSKSLKTVLDQNENLTGWRFSMSDYREQGRMVNVPLYLVEAWLRAQLQMQGTSVEA